ncbi:hypothetical protein DFH09DRAFT_1357522, partial [Mycena vulgaris]
MPPHTSTVVYTFRPKFSREMVEHYPSLTLALGNSYPGLRAPTPVDEHGHNASDYVSDYDAPGSFNGTSSSISAPTTPLEPYFVSHQPAATHMFSKTSVAQLWTTDTIPSRTTASRNNSTVLEKIFPRQAIAPLPTSDKLNPCPIYRRRDPYNTPSNLRSSSETTTEATPSI